MAALTQGDLQVQSAVPVMEIRQFHMEIQANAHPSFYLEGMLSEEDGKEVIGDTFDLFEQWTKERNKG